MFPPLIIGRLLHPIRGRFNRWHREISRIAGELRKSEFASLDALYNIQRQKLCRLCENAAKTSPYFKNLFVQSGLDPQKIDLDTLANLPVLERATVHRHCKDMLNREYPVNKITQNATGGSSGAPLRFYRSHHDLIFAAAIRVREMNWCGMKPGYPHVKLWGAPTDVQSATAGIKAKIWGYLYNQKTINAFDAGPALFEREHGLFLSNPPFLLESYSNILYEFASYLKKSGKAPLNLPAAISSAGVLYDFQRTVIQDTVSRNLYNRYGCREMGNIAHECANHSGLHVHMERHIIEIINPDEDGVGDILVTDLENLAFPFIRYRIGDRGKFSIQKCACGRNLLLLKEIVGRTLDIIRTPSGRLIPGELFPHFFKDYPQITLGQVIQDRIDHIELRLRLQEGAVLDDIEPLLRKINEACNNEVTITVNMEEDFVVNPTGKYRPVISHLESQ